MKHEQFAFYSVLLTTSAYIYMGLLLMKITVWNIYIYIYMIIFLFVNGTTMMRRSIKIIRTKNEMINKIKKR